MSPSSSSVSVSVSVSRSPPPAPHLRSPLPFRFVQPRVSTRLGASQGHVPRSSSAARIPHQSPPRPLDPRLFDPSLCPRHPFVRSQHPLPPSLSSATVFTGLRPSSAVSDLHYRRCRSSTACTLVLFVRSQLPPSSSPSFHHPRRSLPQRSLHALIIVSGLRSPLSAPSPSERLRARHPLVRSQPSPPSYSPNLLLPCRSLPSHSLSSFTAVPACLRR